MSNLEIWTDGSGTLTTGPACIGVALFEDGRLVEECGEHIGQGTNNVAELRALRRGVHLARLRWGTTAPVRIFTDSEYTIDAATRLHPPDKNGPLILAVREQLRELSSWQFVHVRGHQGIFGNELADWLAGGARVAHFASLGVVKKLRARPVAPAGALEAALSANIPVARIQKERKVRKPWAPTIRAGSS